VSWNKHEALPCRFNRHLCGWRRRSGLGSVERHKIRHGRTQQLGDVSNALVGHATSDGVVVNDFGHEHSQRCRRVQLALGIKLKRAANERLHLVPHKQLDPHTYPPLTTNKISRGTHADAQQKVSAHKPRCCWPSWPPFAPAAPRCSSRAAARRARRLGSWLAVVAVLAWPFAACVLWTEIESGNESAQCAPSEVASHDRQKTWW